jgi:long-chain acyl-CoA synthetase
MLDGCKGDLRSLEPSILVGVPAVWEMIRKGVYAKVNDGGLLTRMVFNTAFYLKNSYIPFGATIGDAVFAKMKARMGLGRLTIGMSGGASLSRNTQEWLKTVLVETMLQGYGMTESCGMCVILPPELGTSSEGKNRIGSVGVPVPSVEIMLDSETAKKEAGHEFGMSQGTII